MIDCLNFDTPYWRGVLAGMAIVIRFEKVFNKHYSRKKDKCGVVKLQFVSDDTVETGDTIEQLKVIGGMTGTTATFKIRDNDSKSDPSTLIRDVESKICIPADCITKIATACSRRPWDMTFCVDYIIRHELGHAEDFHNCIGRPLVDVLAQHERSNEMMLQLKRGFTVPMAVTTMDELDKVDGIDVEICANHFAGITDKDRRRWFKIMMRGKNK